MTLFLFVLFCLAALQLFAAAPAARDEAAGAGGRGRSTAPTRLAVLLMMAGFLFVPVLGDFAFRARP